MAGYLTSIVLEFSEDPISDTTPTWQNVTSYMQEIEWWVGVDREGSDPEPGGMRVRLKNTNRDWEPDYTAGTFYPNVTTQRRFRLTLNGVQQGVWYIQDIEIAYPGQKAYSEVEITCGDGTELLALDDLPTLDPPDADTYEDVVGFDEPWGYWRLGEEDGTRARPNVIRGRRIIKRGDEKIRRKFKHRRGTRYRTPAGAVAGPPGAYKSRPLLAQPGLVVGDADFSVLFTAASSDWLRVPLEDGDLEDAQQLSLEAIVKPTSTAGAARYIIGGPVTGGGSAAFWLQHSGSNTFSFGITDTLGNLYTVDGGVAVSANTRYHLVGTFDGTTLRLYVDGVEVGTPATSQGRDLGAWASDVLGIGALPTAANFFDGYIDEAAIYENNLSAARVLAHYTAGANRGYVQQTAGERIRLVAESPLWTETNIQDEGRQVQPMMQHGQTKADVIAELAHAEGPRTLFWFGVAGEPNYLGHEFMEVTANYNTVQWTFGDSGSEIRYEDIELAYDNETFNDVTASAQGGELVNVTDATAISDKGRRANTEWTDVLLNEQADVDHLANDILAFYKQPELRPVTITVNGARALAQILDLDLGHMIQVKRRGQGGTAIDRITSVLGRRCQLDAKSRHMTCTYSLSRGFNAADATWHLGITGYSELDAGSGTTVLG